MALNLDGNKRPYFKQLGLDDTYDEIQDYVNANVNQKYSVSVPVTSAQLDDWGADGTTITLISEIPGKFINVTSVRFTEVGTPSLDYTANWEGATIGLKYSLQYPEQMAYYQCTPGFNGGGSNVQYVAIEANSIILEKLGGKYDAGTLSYTFEIEYELITV